MNDAWLGPYPRFFGALGIRLGDDRSRHLRFFRKLSARITRPVPRVGREPTLAGH